MPNLATAKKSGHAVAHKRMKLKQQQDAEETRWEELEKQKKAKDAQEKKLKKESRMKDESPEELLGDIVVDVSVVNVEGSSIKPSLDSEPTKKRRINPELTNRISKFKKQKAINVSHASSVPINPNLITTSNAFQVLGSKKKK